MTATPAFDTWTVGFSLGALLGLVLAIVFHYSGKKSSRAEKLFITLLMVLFCVMILQYVLYWTKYTLHYPHLSSLAYGFPFLFGPLLFFYFRKVFHHQGLRAKDLLHFIPFVVMSLANIPYLLLSAEEKIAYISGLKKPGGLAHIPWHWLIILHLSMYAIVCFYEFNAASRTTREVKAWFRLILVLFAGFILSFISYFILVQFPGFNNEWDYMISLSMLLFIYTLVFYGYFQESAFNGFSLGDSLQIRKANGMSAQLSHHLTEKLHRAMHDDDLYAEEDLNLEKLANHLGTTKHLLSQFLNEQLGMSFYDYINSLRINKARELLSTTTKKEMRIMEVAYQVGFTTKATFNNTFKKFTGLTPTEYRQQHTPFINGSFLPETSAKASKTGQS